MTFVLDRRVKDIQISKSDTLREDYHVVVLTNSTMKHDSMLYYYGLKTDNKTYYEMKYYTDIYGENMVFDRFTVNSFMIVRNQSFLITTIDNYGLLIYDLVRMEKADSINFHNFFKTFYSDFKITNVVPVGHREMRIFLENKGSLSLVWDGIDESKANGYILDKIQAKNRFVNLNHQQSTGVVDFSDLSIVQIGYNLKKGGFFDTFVRVERQMNHEKSKSFREYNLGMAPECNFIDLQCSDDRIVVICGDKFYILNYVPFPRLEIFKNSGKGSAKFELQAYNGYSERKLEFEITSKGFDSSIPKWVILVGF